jgi:hypothetical protein
MWSPYIVIDDFLDREHLRKLSEIPFKTSGAEWEMLTHTITNDGTVTRSFMSSVNRTETPYFSEQDSIDIYNAHHQYMLSALQELNPERAKRQIKHTELNIVMSGKDFVWPIHNDSKDKMLSVVIFVAPNENEGTWLYEDQAGANPRQIEWKPNRAFIFSRNTDTWHSYKADGKNNRLTLVYNLIGYKNANK